MSTRKSISVKEHKNKAISKNTKLRQLSMGETRNQKIQKLRKFLAQSYDSHLFQQLDFLDQVIQTKQARAKKGSQHQNRVLIESQTQNSLEQSEYPLAKMVPMMDDDTQCQFDVKVENGIASLCQLKVPRNCYQQNLQVQFKPYVWVPCQQSLDKQTDESSMINESELDVPQIPFYLANCSDSDVGLCTGLAQLV